MVLFGSLALGGQPVHLKSPDNRTAFRRWFTFLTESRYYAHKPLRDINDGTALMQWAYRQALVQHDAAWAHSVELPLFPYMPSVRQFAPAAGPEPVFISRELDQAEPGDLLIYRRSELPSHLMVYIGKSQVLPSPRRWVIYLTARPKQIHKVAVDTLREDPNPQWHPDPANPDFLGVWRLDLLRPED